ncbi:MAG: YkgJ family cysteine cluster protein [archaeon]
MTRTSKDRSYDLRRCRTQTTALSWKRSEFSGNVMFHPSGVLWQCQRCAMCCADTPDHTRSIRLLQTESEMISRRTGMDVNEFSRATTGSLEYDREILKKNGKCLFLTDKSCAIYHDRPLTCIFYPLFFYQVNPGRFEFRITPESCPGLGVGRKLNGSCYKELLSLAIETFRRNRSRQIMPLSFLDPV